MAEESRILVKASVEGRRMLITNWLNPMIMVVMIRERLCLQFRGKDKRVDLCCSESLKELLHLADRKLVLPLLKTGQSLLLESLQSANGFEGTGGEWLGD